MKSDFVQERIILVAMWNPSKEKEVFVTASLEDIIANPSGVNLALLGFTFLNMLRSNRGLPALEEEVGRLLYYKGEFQNETS